MVDSRARSAYNKTMLCRLLGHRYTRLSAQETQERTVAHTYVCVRCPRNGLLEMRARPLRYR